MSLSSLAQITIMAVAFFMVVNGSITTGAVVSSVIVSSRMSGIISNLSSTLVALLSAEKTTKDLVGQRVCIIGDCGAGKSSLLTLLSGYITPTEGAILYDGYNLGHLSQSFFFQQLSVVTAQDVLFNRQYRK